MPPALEHHESSGSFDPAEEVFNILVKNGIDLDPSGGYLVPNRLSLGGNIFGQPPFTELLLDEDILPPELFTDFKGMLCCVHHAAMERPEDRSFIQSLWMPTQEPWGRLFYKRYVIPIEVQDGTLDYMEDQIRTWCTKADTHGLIRDYLKFFKNFISPEGAYGVDYSIFSYWRFCEAQEKIKTLDRLRGLDEELPSGDVRDPDASIPSVDTRALVPGNRAFNRLMRFRTSGALY